MLAALLISLCLLISALGCGGKSASGTPVTLGNVFPGSDNLTKRLVVVPFSSGIPTLKDRAQDLEAGVNQYLKSLNRFALTDFEELAQAMKQVHSAVNDPRARMLMAGRLLGLNTIISGQMTDLSVEYSLTGIYGFRDNTPFLGLESELTVIDVASGTILGQRPFRQEEEISDVEAEGIKLGESPKKDKVDKLAQRMNARIKEWIGEILSGQGWTGYVLAVEGNRVKITAGKDTGFKKGDQLSLYALGERIVSGTGLPLYLPGPLAGTIILNEIGDRTTWADFVPQDKSSKTQPPLEPGMVVRAK
jgi:hypothetical protein